MTATATGLPTSRPSRGAPLLGAAGALGAVAALLGAFAVLPADAGGASAAAIADRYAASGWVPATVLQVAGIAGVLVLAAALTDVLRDAQRPVRALLLAGAAVAAALQLTGHAVIATLAAGTAARGNGDVVLALYDLSSIAFAFGSAGAAVFLAATAAGVLGTRSLPRWLGWAAAATAAVSALAAGSLAAGGAFGVHGDVGFAAVVLVHLWFLLAGIALLRRRP